MADKSAFLLAVWSKDGKPMSDVVHRDAVPPKSLVVHLNGDRMCKKEKTGFVKEMAKKLSIDDLDGLIKLVVN